MQVNNKTQSMLLNNKYFVSQNVFAVYFAGFRHHRVWSVEKEIVAKQAVDDLPATVTDCEKMREVLTKWGAIDVSKFDSQYNLMDEPT